MFEDSGTKVKSVARLFFLLILISMIAYGAISCRSISAFSGSKVSEKGFFTFLLIAGIGFVTAWISGVMIHAFGELVESTHYYLKELTQASEKIQKSQERLEKQLEQIVQKGLQTSIPQQKITESIPKAEHSDGILCPICHSLNRASDRYCSKCHQPLQQDAHQEQIPNDQKQSEPPADRSKVCPKCHRDNPADYLYCQYCGECLK